MDRFRRRFLNKKTDDKGKKREGSGSETNRKPGELSTGDKQLAFMGLDPKKYRKEQGQSSTEGGEQTASSSQLLKNRLKGFFTQKETSLTPQSTEQQAQTPIHDLIDAKNILIQYQGASYQQRWDIAAELAKNMVTQKRRYTEINSLFDLDGYHDIKKVLQILRPHSRDREEAFQLRQRAKLPGAAKELKQMASQKSNEVNHNAAKLVEQMGYPHYVYLTRALGYPLLANYYEVGNIYFASFDLAIIPKEEIERHNFDPHIQNGNLERLHFAHELPLSNCFTYAFVGPHEEGSIGEFNVQTIIDSGNYQRIWNGKVSADSQIYQSLDQLRNGDILAYYEHEQAAFPNHAARIDYIDKKEGEVYIRAKLGNETGDYRHKISFTMPEHGKYVLILRPWSSNPIRTLTDSVKVKRVQDGYQALVLPD